MDPEKIKVIGGWRPPTTVHEVRQFIGLCGFYQQFVEGFQAVAAPLTAMFKADFEWEWTAAHQDTFNKLKQAMINATILSAIDPTAAVSLAHRYFESLRGGHSSTAMCTWEVQGTSSTCCLYVVEDAIC